MSEQLLTGLTEFSILFWILIFLFSKDLQYRKYDIMRITVGLFVVGTAVVIFLALPEVRLDGFNHSVRFRGHLFSLASGFLVLASLIHSSIFKERWTLKSLALLALSFGLVCRAFTFNDVLLTGIIVAVLLLLFSQAPLISNRDPSGEELSLGLFFFLLTIAGFATSAALFESSIGSLLLKDVILIGNKTNAKAHLGWLFGFISSVFVLVLPFFGLFQAGVHRSRSWPIHNWLLGMLGLAGVSSALAWIDASEAIFPQNPFFSKAICFLVGVILSALAMIQGCFSKKVSAVFQTWTMTPLVTGFVAYALGNPEGEILSVISFSMWIFGLIAVGATLNLLEVETEFTLEQLSRRLQEA
jgi:hypothetical protein